MEQVMYKWSKTEGYECSSKGDKRFSALYARLPDGRTIEQHYQCDVKGYDVGGLDWRLGKGKPPVDPDMTKESLLEAYFFLWRWWAYHNPELIEELRNIAKTNNNTMRDSFATSEINQAHALVDILNMEYSI